MVNKKLGIPDYELDDRRTLESAVEIKALTHALRGAILDLLLERAATITELSAALKRPKSTVAHHVSVLVDAGLLRVVRSRRVRAMEERFYGRTARLFTMGTLSAGDFERVPWDHPLSDAVRESQTAYESDTMWANLRHARIPRSTASQFWSRVEDLMNEFSSLAREGDEVFGLAAALYATDFPALHNTRNSSAAAPPSDP